MFLAGSIAPIAVWLLATLGKDSDGLLLASEIVRYLFTILPPFPMVRSLMAIAQVTTHFQLILRNNNLQKKSESQHFISYFTFTVVSHLLQIQDENNICTNFFDKETLLGLCKGISDLSELPARGEVALSAII